MIKILLLTNLLLFSCLELSQAQIAPLSFRHLGTEDGLSQETNAYVYQDSRGLIWMSSLAGLNRFDGLEVKVYQPNPDDSLSIAGGIVTSRLQEDAAGNLWFTTNEAINCYQRATDNFRSFQVRDEQGNLKTEDYYAFHLDLQQQLWVRVGTGVAGQLHLFNIETLTDLPSYPLDGQRCEVVLNAQQEVKQVVSSMFFSRPGFTITDIKKGGQKTHFSLTEAYTDVSYEGFTYNTYVENDATLWIGGMGKLLEFSLVEKKVVNSYLAEFADVFCGSVWSIVPYQDRYLFTGTLEGGILLFDKQKKTFVQQFKKQAGDKNSLNNNSVRELYLDPQDNLWVSRYTGGIAYTNLHQLKFQLLHPTAGKRVQAIFSDPVNQQIWVAADRELQQFDINKNRLATYHSYQYQEGQQNSFSEKNFYAPLEIIFRDSTENLWAVILKRLFRFDSLNRRWQAAYEYEYKINDAYTLTDGTSLLAMENGVYSLDSKNGTTTAFTALGDYQAAFYTRIFADQNKRLYLAENATHLLVFAQQANGYQLERKIANVGYCYYFYEDTAKLTLWVATSKGVLKINTVSLEYELFNEATHGLPSEVFYSVISDNNNGLWLSGNRGIIHYRIAEKDYQRFSVTDGLQSREFLPNVGLQTATGEVWLGGTKGVNVFYPNQIEQNNALPKVYFTKLLINDEPYATDVQIGELEQLNLSYQENTISLNFVALEYSDATNNQFKYQLIGGNYNTSDQWIDNQNRGFIRFANLPPGDYQLKVKAANADGRWNEVPQTLRISIIPPFWKTTWAYLLYLILTAGGIYFWYRFSLKRQIEKAEAHQLKEIDRLKTRFYTNITHEFRTPLTVILGIANQLETGVWTTKVSAKEENRLKTGFNLIERNGKKLLNLINQLLDLSKLDSNNLMPHYQAKEVVSFVQYVGESFETLAAQKQVKLGVYSEIDTLVMDVDEIKLQQIIANLLSNAIKFTPPRRKVILHLSQKLDQLEIKIKDNGIGIAPTALPHIFDRFYQVDNSESRQGEGTGIGLALVKELVDLLEGTISVTSKTNQGTTFVVTLPIHNNQSTEATKTLQPLPPPISTATTITVSEINQPDHNLNTTSPLFEETITSKSQLLIAEDNLDVTFYIQSILAEHYEIQIAKDGQEGIEKALAQVPDIIISDVMMPRKTGFELVETLKQDERTSHIPIVLLTAKATQADKLAGLKYGADAYLMKPFDKEELFIRLEKLLEIRRNLQQRYSQNIANSSAQIATADPQPLSPDDLFIAKLHATLEKRYEDADLTIPQIAKTLKLSQQQFYRKLKALTNQTPVRYLRSFRLHKAKALLLTANDLNVSEVAYEVGFDSPNYFSRAFAEEFGKSPNEVNRKKK
ncbi:MAG: ATP-binding protein [Saprospiraceae bacterium]